MTAPSIFLIADRPDVVPGLASALERQWPDWYGSRGNARADLDSRCRRSELPIGFVALDGETPIGTIAIEKRSTATHTHLSPWIVGLWVAPSRRNARIAVRLMAAACDHAKRMGFHEIYTSAARQRRKPMAVWQQIGTGVTDGGDEVDIFRLSLQD
jgi:GNAT superfamily N-acetyltransferase